MHNYCYMTINIEYMLIYDIVSYIVGIHYNYYDIIIIVQIYSLITCN